MMLAKLFQWRGAGRLYTLPWMKNRIEYSADSSRIARYARTRFTRSRMVMNLLTQFHLSKNSILVSSDRHAALLKPLLTDHFPAADQYPLIAKNLTDRIFASDNLSGEYKTIQVSSLAIRGVYVTLLETLLGVKILRPLEAYLAAMTFRPGWRPLQLEGVMYSLGLHAPIFSPLRVALDLVFFREARAMRKIAKKLEEEVYYFTVPLPGSWRETLEKLREQGKISRQQFRGELTSMLVASFSLASALGAALMCLAACPAYVDKIRKDPAFSTFFLMEVLRLYPPFRQFGYERTPHHKDHSFGAATDFMIAVYALHRHPDEWKFPNAFWPERFVEKGTQGGFKYLPFGMGKRSCPGRLYSMRLLSEVIKYVCSENSGIVLQKKNLLPVGSNGRLVSFVIDDGLIFQRIHSGEQKCTVT